MYEDKLKWSKELSERILKDFNPYAVIVGYTGGTDSNIALKLATMFFHVDAAFTCNTTIAAIETLTNCERIAKEIYKLKYISRMPPYNNLSENADTYFEIVKRHGFPGKTKTAHNWMYRYLKDHTISRIISSIRNHKRNKTIVIISGARKHESVRRMGTSRDVTLMGNNIWVNIANDWTDSECKAFALDYKIDFFRSPISKCIGISGECFCGAFAQSGELTEIKYASPTTYDKIIFIDNWLKNNTDKHWGWEESPRLERKIEIKNTLSPNMLMCSTCMKNGVQFGESTIDLTVPS